MLKGYKSFNNDMTNKFGTKFEEGETYSEDCELVFNVDVHGFMFCKNLEDTIYFAPDRKNVTFAEVTALGDVVEGVSGQDTYENLYTTNKIRIDKILKREEVIDMFLNMSPNGRLIRFIEMFNLTPEEIEMFREKFVASVPPTVKVIKADGTVEYDYVDERERVRKALDFFQMGDKEAYQKTKLKQSKN